MKNKSQALRLLREWPVEKRGRTTLLDGDGNRCALGVMAGDEIQAALAVPIYVHFFGPRYGLTHIQCWEILRCNDGLGFQEAVRYVEGLPDDES